MAATARLAGYYFAYFAYAGAYVPYFALYLSAKGFGATQIAAVLAMPQLARVFVPTFWGWLADRTGARRAIVIFSGLVLVVGYALLYLLESFAAVAALMLVLSVLSAGALPVVEAMTLGALEGRGGQYGPVRLWGSVGFILSVLALGAWLDYRPPATILDWILALAVLSSCVTWFLPRDAGRQEAHGGPGMARVLARAEVRALLGACFCMTVAHGALYAFFTLYLEARGYAKSLIGALWTLGVLAEIAVFLLWPRIVRRFSLRLLLLASFVAAALRFLAIGWGVGSLALLAVAQLLHAATFGVYHAASVAAFHRLFPGRLAARGQALYASLAFGLGGVTGVLVAGWTWEAIGPELSFTLSAAFGAAGALLVAWKVRI